ncbi:MAG: tripartite tricarboxylate transporter TctB family protein [Alphaproteobacteria bacterium]
MKLNDAILGALILLGGLAIVLEARTFPPTHGQAFGPDLFPTIIGAGFALAGLVLIAGGWRARRAVGWIDTSGITIGRMVDGLLVVLAILGFILFTGYLGFIITGGLSTWLLTVRFRRGMWISSLAVAVATVLAVDWAFRGMLLVPLPQGVLLPRLPW